MGSAEQDLDSSGECMNASEAAAYTRVSGDHTLNVDCDQGLAKYYVPTALNGENIMLDKPKPVFTI